MSPPATPRLPTYLGMVICDHVIQDPESKKYYLLGTATVTFAGAFPARHERLSVYAVLTDLHGKHNVRLRLVYVNPESTEDTEIMAIGGEVEAPDPLAVAELVFGLRNLIFAQPGDYRFQLYTDNNFLGERRFSVNRMPTQPPQQKA
jgi:hypothetical protein